ncbi:MAG: DUF6111 family protein [Hyphomicrobiaceae bacterium]
MLRIVIENALLFLLPTALYVAYVYLAGRAPQKANAVLNDAPLVWLFVAGAVLVVVTLMTFGSSSGGRPGEAYEPAIFKDGHIEPGHIK